MTDRGRDRALFVVTALAAVLAIGSVAHAAPVATAPPAAERATTAGPPVTVAPAALVALDVTHVARLGYVASIATTNTLDTLQRHVRAQLGAVALALASLDRSTTTDTLMRPGDARLWRRSRLTLDTLNPPNRLHPVSNPARSPAIGREAFPLDV